MAPSRTHPPPPLIVPVNNNNNSNGSKNNNSNGSLRDREGQPLSSPRSPRQFHPTSSLRDPLPGATPPVVSRSPSASSDLAGDDFLANQTKGAGKRRTRKADGHSDNRHNLNDPDQPSPNLRGDKRRRVASKSSRQVASDGVAPSPSRSHGQSNADSHSPSSPQPSGRRMPPTLAPIKPIGFAQSRESRREEGDHPIPSPVVMGFDFKAIDDTQLRTVRDTISIKEQQQALIAARRREVAASTPATPKELTFKGWQPKDADRLPSSGGVGKRREKTRERVEGLTIHTGILDKDHMPGSKSAPLGQALSAQQQSPRDPLGGPTILPPLPGYSHMDARTAPISHTRTRTGDDPRDDYGRGQFWRPLPRPSGYENMPHTARPTISIAPSDRRNYTTSVLQPAHSHDRRTSGPRASRSGQYSRSPTPPRGASRDAFPQPAQSMYDLMHQADQLRFSLQDLLHRYEGALSSQHNQMGDFKATAAQANTLLGSLQASADSLKEMVRYEVGRAGSAEKREVDELRERIKRLEEKLEAQVMEK